MKRSRSKVPLLHRLKSLYPQEKTETLLAWILCGEVEIEGGRIKDPRYPVDKDAQPLHLPDRFVSRGGWKLEGALESWGWDVTGKVLVDAGSSTGGFTDCLLQRGASLVHAVDVGRGQLHQKLRLDPRVRLQEGIGILEILGFDPPVDGGVADLSFRSLRGAAKHILERTKENWLIALIKPQFEWRHPPQDFHGVVPREFLPGILEDVLTGLQEEGVGCRKLLPSSLPGTAGNQEYLGLLFLGAGLSLPELLRF